MMRKAYLLFAIVVLVLVISSYFLHFSDNGVSVSSSTSGNNLLTGFATQGNDPAIPPSCDSLIIPERVIYGDVDGCFVYDRACPCEETIEMFRVNYDFFSLGGGHVAEVDNDDFPLRMCCKNILGPDNGGDRDFTLFYTGYTIGGEAKDITQEYGSHIYPNNLADKTSDYVALETRIGNYVEYVAGECPIGWNCIAKASPLDTEGYDFYNSHIWNCNRTFDEVAMVSICYKPEHQTDCTSWQGTCNYPGYYYDPNHGVSGSWLYCSFGIDDLQDPEYPSSGYETGICCLTGLQYNSGGFCRESSECGFNDENDPCYLPVNPNPDYPPGGFMEKEYFDQAGCVKWDLQESCCWNIKRYGDFGNYYCDFSSLTWSENSPQE